jgi:hypothetical protein
MTTQIYEALTDMEKRQVGMFGCTEAQMRDAVEDSLTFRFQGPAFMAASLMSDAQEELNFDIESARQTLNRAKWILFTYCDKERSNG